MSRFLSFGFAGAMLLSASAHADFLYLRADQKGIDSRACYDGMSAPTGNEDDSLAMGFVQSETEKAGLSFSNYYPETSQCRNKPGLKEYSFSSLYAGSEESVARLTLNPPIFYGKYMTVKYEATHITRMVAHYKLLSSNTTDTVEDILARPIVDLNSEQLFVNGVCRPDTSNLRNALRGSPNEAQANQFLNQYGGSYKMAYTAELTTDSGATILLDGLGWMCFAAH